MEIVSNLFYTGASLAELARVSPQVVAITLGGRGCIVFDEKNFFSVPAFNINVVDTTGAGARYGL